MQLKKILIMGDEEDSLTYFSAFFANEGFFVISASNKENVVQKVLSEKPDIITLDISRSQKYGLKALREIQNSKDTCEIPVVITTAVASDFKRLIRDRKQLHMPEGFFEKPIDRDLLLNKVKELLELNAT